MVDWILQDFDGRMSLQARFLTLWGARRALRKKGFSRSQFDPQSYYICDKAAEVCAGASIREGVGDYSRVVSIVPRGYGDIAKPSSESKRNVVRWLIKESMTDLWAEGRPQTLAQANEVLSFSGFRRVQEDIEGHYKREWNSAGAAIADLIANRGSVGYIIQIRYYDQEGNHVRNAVDALRVASGQQL